MPVQFVAAPHLRSSCYLRTLAAGIAWQLTLSQAALAAPRLVGADCAAGVGDTIASRTDVR